MVVQSIRISGSRDTFTCFTKIVIWQNYSRASRTRYIHIQTFDIRTANDLNNCCCFHGFSHHEYVTFLRLPSAITLELISTQGHVTAELHDAQLATSSSYALPIYTETANDFNQCVVHTASVVTNLYTSPVCAFLVLYNAELISIEGHVAAETHAAKLGSRRPTRYIGLYGNCEWLQKRCCQVGGVRLSRHVTLSTRNWRRQVTYKDSWWLKLLRPFAVRMSNVWMWILGPNAFLTRINYSSSLLASISILLLRLICSYNFEIINII